MMKSLQKLLTEQFYGFRRAGRPQLRWMVGVREDSDDLMGVRNEIAVTG